jgi:hypothetical protein
LTRFLITAGDNHIIGYHVANESEQYATMFSKYLPKLKAQFHDYTNWLNKKAIEI